MIIDDGAREALCRDRKSLPIGVVDVHGSLTGAPWWPPTKAEQRSAAGSVIFSGRAVKIKSHPSSELNT